jgi:hypothetical protein
MIPVIFKADESVDGLFDIAFPKKVKKRGCINSLFT